MLKAFQFGLLVLMLAILALLSAITTMHFAIHGAEVKVPNLRGLTILEATRKAAELGLNLSVESRSYSVDIPEGHVLNQSPAAGTVVRREWHVRLTESIGPQKVAIPSLTGEDQRVASIQVRRAGLELGSIAEMPYAYAAPGTVIAQNPAPGAAGVERPSVSLLIAAPPAAATNGFVMPDLTGQLFTNAAMTVTKAGLKLEPAKSMQAPVQAVGELGSATTGPPVPPKPPIQIGSVISQKPLPGTRVDASTSVELTVAE